jgi:hypothetical protein
VARRQARRGSGRHHVLFPTVGRICLHRRRIHRSSLPESLTFTCRLPMGKSTTSSPPPNQANANYTSTRTPIGRGGTIASGRPTSRGSIPSKNIHSRPRPSASTRFGVPVFPRTLGCTAMTANSQVHAITIFPRATSDKSTAGWLVLDLK